ncbi:MAG: hypothetical protein U0Z75_07575 [Deinococcaceae bacterium]
MQHFFIGDSDDIETETRNDIPQNDLAPILTIIIGMTISIAASSRACQL